MAKKQVTVTLAVEDVMQLQTALHLAADLLGLLDAAADDGGDMARRRGMSFPELVNHVREQCIAGVLMLDREFV